MRLALFEPDIPQNVGAVVRLAACVGLPVDLIEPFGFVWSSPKLRRAGMDYLEQADIQRHPSWDAFRNARPHGRLILATTLGAHPYTTFEFRNDDVILFGSESAGVPPMVHGAATARIVIPMRPSLRSINVAQSVAMIVGEALRQTGAFPSGVRDGQGDGNAEER